MKRFFRSLILLIYLLPSLLASAGNVQGTISNNRGEPLAFCNVYVSNTGFACASNENGYYEFQLPDGKYAITFQYIGYKKQTHDVVISAHPVQLNVVMEEDITELAEIEVRSDQEDPAYAVMRKAIDLREEHLKENTEYACEVYIKGMQKLLEAPDKILGIELKTVVDVDSNNTGIIYLSESVSNFNFKYPDKTKEIMKASRVSGNSQQFSWNDAASMQMNFYQNLETLEGFSQRGFVSPVADNAMFFYEYHLLGSSFENNHEIFRIQVTPKRNTDPAYTGTIYITDNDYRISGIQLALFKANGLEFIDTFKVEQEFYYTVDAHLALLSNKFNFNYSIFGIHGEGYFHAFYKDYNFQPGFKDNFFGPAVTKIEDNANKKDSVYWGDTRPVPLTDEERTDYHQKDSLMVIKETDAYKDSMDRIFNHISAGDLISGYNYRNTKNHLFINTNPVFDLLKFNTVEGYVIDPKVRMQWHWDNNKEFTFLPDFRYSIGTGRMRINAMTRWLYDQRTSSEIQLRGGETVAQFNESGIGPLSNTVHSLLLELNGLKIYDKKFAEIKWTREIFNGFYLTAATGYEQRTALNNLSGIQPWFNAEDVVFTDNNEPVFGTTDPFIPSKYNLQLNVRYVFHQTYIDQPDNKYILDSKYPVLRLSLQKAVPGIFNAAVNYLSASVAVNDNIKFGLPGNLQYQVSSGGFISKSHLSPADRIYFNANESYFSKLQEDAFFLLPYYGVYAENYFAEAHVQWHTEGFLFRKLPLFKQLKVEPVFSCNLLSTDQTPGYMELAAGIEHIFKVARFDFAWSAWETEDGRWNHSTGILFGIGF